MTGAFPGQFLLDFPVVGAGFLQVDAGDHKFSRGDHTPLTTL